MHKLLYTPCMLRHSYILSSCLLKCKCAALPMWGLRSTGCAWLLINWGYTIVHRHAVLAVRGVELSDDFEADALVKLSVKRSDRRQIVTHTVYNTLHICVCVCTAALLTSPLVCCRFGQFSTQTVVTVLIPLL